VDRLVCRKKSDVTLVHEKAFRDLGFGLMTTEKEDFIVIYGDN